MLSEPSFNSWTERFTQKNIGILLTAELSFFCVSSTASKRRWTVTGQRLTSADTKRSRWGLGVRNCADQWVHVQRPERDAWAIVRQSTADVGLAWRRRLSCLYVVTLYCTDGPSVLRCSINCRLLQPSVCLSVFNDASVSRRQAALLSDGNFTRTASYWLNYHHHLAWLN